MTQSHPASSVLFFFYLIFLDWEWKHSLDLFSGDWNEQVISVKMGWKSWMWFWCFCSFGGFLCRSFDQMSIRTEDFTMSDSWSTVPSECASVISLNLSPSEPVSPTRRHRKVHVRRHAVLFTAVHLKLLYDTIWRRWWYDSHLIVHYIWWRYWICYSLIS